MAPYNDLITALMAIGWSIDSASYLKKHGVAFTYGERHYILCDLPGHNHHVNLPFKNCLNDQSHTWESRYSH